MDTILLVGSLRKDQVENHLPTLNGKEWVRTGWRILTSSREDDLWTQQGPPVDTVIWVLPYAKDHVEIHAGGLEW